MPRPGWIKLYYSILDNPMWTQDVFTEGQAWVDLLLLAAHEEHNTNGTTWNPGEVHISKNNLAKRWGWSRRKIDAYLTRLEEDNMVERSFERSFEPRSKLVLTIVKWQKYQGKKQSASQSERSFERKNVRVHKNIYKKGGDNGSSPCPAGKMEVVKNEHGEWVARQLE